MSELKQETGAGASLKVATGADSHHHATALYRNMGSSTEPFLPLCHAPAIGPSSHPGVTSPPARVPGTAPIHTRLPRCASFWRVCCCGNCLTVPFADRAQDDPPHRYRLRPRTRSAANGSAQCATRPRSAVPDQFYSAELFQNNTTPVLRRTNGLESAPAVATVLIAQNAKSPIPISAEPVRAE